MISRDLPATLACWSLPIVVHPVVLRRIVKGPATLSSPSQPSVNTGHSPAVALPWLDADIPIMKTCTACRNDHGGICSSKVLPHTETGAAPWINEASIVDLVRELDVNIVDVIGKTNEFLISRETKAGLWRGDVTVFVNSKDVVCMVQEVKKKSVDGTVNALEHPEVLGEVSRSSNLFVLVAAESPCFFLCSAGL